MVDYDIGEDCGQDYTYPQEYDYRNDRELILQELQIRYSADVRQGWREPYKRESLTQI